MRGRCALVGVALLSLLPMSMSVFAQSTTGGPVPAQTQRPIPPAPKPAATTQVKPDPGMTNDAVIRMVKAGLSEELIIGSIKAATKRAFNVSADGLIALKTAGVSDRIMMVMVGIEPPPAPVAALTPVPSAKAEPAAPVRGPGFYVSAAGTETPLNPSVISGGKAGTKRMILTGGLGKVKMKAVVKGERSGIRVSVPTHIIFVAGNGLTHPNEISIVQLGLEDKSRVFQVGEAGAWSGVSSGVKDEDCLPYKPEKIGPDTYKLVLDKPLPPGEYALVSPAMVQVSPSGSTGKVWDFGVDK